MKRIEETRLRRRKLVNEMKALIKDEGNWQSWVEFGRTYLSCTLAKAVKIRKEKDI